MRTILKLIGNLIAFGYGIFFIPIILLLLIFMPFMTISDGMKIIGTGYTVKGEYLYIMMSILILIYFSLRFRNLRKIYSVFPSLFEVIKFLTITNLFIAIGTEVLNWSYITINAGRHTLGIVIFIISLLAWRIFVSVYYTKKPLINFIPKREEEIKNYGKNSYEGEIQSEKI